MLVIISLSKYCCLALRCNFSGYSPVSFSFPFSIASVLHHIWVILNNFLAKQRMQETHDILCGSTGKQCTYLTSWHQQTFTFSIVCMCTSIIRCTIFVHNWPMQNSSYICANFCKDCLLDCYWGKDGYVCMQREVRLAEQEMIVTVVLSTVLRQLHHCLHWLLLTLHH